VNLYSLWFLCKFVNIKSCDQSKTFKGPSIKFINSIINHSSFSIPNSVSHKPHIHSITPYTVHTFHTHYSSFTQYYTIHCTHIPYTLFLIYTVLHHTLYTHSIHTIPHLHSITPYTVHTFHAHYSSFTFHNTIHSKLVMLNVSVTVHRILTGDFFNIHVIIN
jgi:hypothetical protein